MCSPIARVASLHEWRHQLYHKTTIVWSLTLLAVPSLLLSRMQMGLSAQVLLMSSLHLLTCLTLGAAVWGSTACLRAFTTMLMVVRSAGYIGIGMGWIPLSFKRQAFSYSAVTADFPLATFGYVAALLIDTIGLVHVHVPRLQLLLQTLASIISSLSVGNSFMSSVIKSIAVHGLCGLIYAVLEHRDLRCYAALLEAQKPGGGHKGPQHKPQALEAQGSSSMAAADGATRVSSKAQSAKSGGEDPRGAFQGLQDALLMRSSKPSGPSSDAVLSSAEVAAVLTPGAHLAAPPERHTMPTDAANSLPSFPAPMLRSLTSMPAPSKPWVPHPASLDELYHALQQRFVGPEGAERQQTLRGIAAILQSKSSKRHRYKKLFRRHLAVMKVPGSVHPGNLPASALPSLASLINARDPEYTMGDVAMRCGCILLTMDIQEELQTNLVVESPGTQDSVAHKLAASARLWLQETQLADQLPASVPVLLQVNGTVLKMVREPGTNSWSITDFSSAAPPSSEYSITAVSPAALLPTQQQQQQQHVQFCSEECTLQLRAHVRMPAGFGVVGWDGTNSARSQPAAHNSSGKGSEDLQVLASLGGSGYLRTRVDAVTKSDGGDFTELQVRVSLPLDQAASTRPCTLALELWQQHTLHSSSTLLLLPAVLQGVAAELQLLPWAEEDVAEYVHDLGKWLHLHTPPCLSATSAQLHSCPSAWETGQLLLRQAVLWGLPAVSTLLLDSLMALPSAPAMPFTHTAHAPASIPAAHLPPPEELGLDDLGGLLHLALLSPDSSGMLATVLDWGRRWGACEPGFAWRWCERSRAGLSPLNILAAMPRDSATMQLVLSENEQSRVFLDAASIEHHSREHDQALPHIAQQQQQQQPGALTPLPSFRSTLPHSLSGMLKRVHRATHALRLLLRLVWASLTSSQALFEQALGYEGDSHSSSSAGSSIALSSSQPPTQLPGSSESSSWCCKSGKREKPASSEVVESPAGVSGRGVGDEGDREAAYRSWANTQAAMVARIFGLFHVTSIVFLVVRDLHRMGIYEGLHNSLAAYGPFFSVYALGTLILYTRPRYSEVAVTSFTFFRFLLVLLGGLGVVKITPASRRGLSTAFIYLFEPFYKSLSEQVRITWVLPLRVFGVVAYASQHMLLQLPGPWLRSLSINVISFAVSLLMDMRMRRMYYHNSQRATSTHAKSA